MHHEHSSSPCTEISVSDPTLATLGDKLKDLMIKSRTTHSKVEIKRLFDDIISYLKYFFKSFTTPSEIEENRSNFIYIFDYISSLLKRRDPTTSNPLLFKMIIESRLIQNLLRSLLTPMLKVEVILRDKNPRRINSLTKDLFLFLGVFPIMQSPLHFIYHNIIDNDKCHDFLETSINIFKHGSSMSLEEEFVESILASVKMFSVLSHTTSMHISFDSFLPYVIPWMEKYQSQRLCGDWISILRGFMYDPFGESLNSERMEKCWHLFPKLFEVIKKEISLEIPIINVQDDHQSKRSEFDFQDYFVNFLDISFYFCSCSHTAEVFDILKDSLDDIIKFVVTHRVDGHMASFLQLMSSFSAIPSIVPHISPKYDEDVLYCHRNRNYHLPSGNYYSLGTKSWYYLRYFLNCHSSPSIQKLDELIGTIKEYDEDEGFDDEAFDQLFLKYQDSLLEIFSSCCTSHQSIRDHRIELVLCVGCLVFFFSQRDLSLSEEIIQLIFANFYDYLSRIVQGLEGDIDYEFGILCEHFLILTFCVEPLTILVKIEPELRYLFKQGAMNKLCGDTPSVVLNICNEWASVLYDTNPGKLLLLNIVGAYFKDWLRIYQDTQVCVPFFSIPNTISSEVDEIIGEKDIAIYDEIWPMFDALFELFEGKEAMFFKDGFCEENILNAQVYQLFDLMAHLSSIHSNAIKIYDLIKDMLPIWSEDIRCLELGVNNPNLDARLLGNLVSVFSNVPSLVPHLSPRFDEILIWCTKREMNNNDVLNYISNCYPKLSHWVDKVKHLQKGVEFEEGPGFLYRDEIFSLFLAYQSREEIQEHKLEFLMCMKCLRTSIDFYRSEKIFSWIIDLVENMFDHLINVQQILNINIISQGFWEICLTIASIVSFCNDDDESFPGINDSLVALFLSKISPIIGCYNVSEGIEGSGRMISLRELEVLLDLLRTDNITTSLSILGILKPFIKPLIDRITIENNDKSGDSYSKCSVLIDILTTILAQNSDQEMNPTLLAEIWDIFLAFREFFQDYYGKLLLFRRVPFGFIKFLSRLCCDQVHTCEIFSVIKDKLDNWVHVIEANEEILMIELIDLVISLSKVPSIVPQLSPKYDGHIVLHCKQEGCVTLPLYLQNVYSHISRSFLSPILHSIPSISLIPTIETTQYPNSSSILPTTHFCDGIKYVSSISGGYLQHQESTICLIVGGTELEYSRVRYGELCVETCVANERKEEEEAAAEEKETREKEEGEKETEITRNTRQVTHSSLIKYTPPQHMLVTMSFTEERPLRQSVYDFIERTGACETEITRNTRQVTHSSLIKYTPPQHMLVTMSFTEERPLRQSVYDFIERTGACVEILFEEQTCLFEAYEQEAWKEGMEEVEEECKMKRSQEISGCEDLVDFDPFGST
ncbi:hypothetical protein ADUPG1_009171 [Aduncisulcus paluster]|uniref:Uncharacterized protein n=1 Tax=Aduncisulcus paluster TaxID=2918883 RepID=A0ABQ5KVV4_9EUKA|nr:hypothetical protein ADUPG1_009171 [Aduncisulcus paluster]